MPHPFMQRDFPEIRRDKFEPGVELSKTEFEAAALGRPDPLEGAEAAATADMSPDLHAAIDFVTECGSGIVAERDRRLKRLRVIASLLEPLRGVLDSIKLPCARLIADEFNVAWTVVALEAIQWPDDELALRYITGFPVAFDIPDSGVFREIDAPAQTQEADFMATNIQMNRSVKQSLSKPPSGAEEEERAKMCWKRTEEEIEAGLVFGPVSGAQLDRKYGRGKWRAIKRSAIIQGEKVRCIDDAKRNGLNKATQMHETVVCSRSDFPAKAARAFAERALEAGEPIPMMEHGLEDLFAAYRRAPTSQPQFTLVALWRPDPKLDTGGEVVYIEVPGHNFGLLAAVVNFNRAPEAFIAVARQLLGVVAEHYVDDFDMCEPTFAMKTGAACMVEICSPTFFGFAFADEKHEEMGLSNVYLGVLTDFSTLLSHGSIIVGITQKRRKKLRDLVDTALATRIVPGAITQSIIGKARFVLSAAFSSIGKACLQPLQQHAAQREPGPLSEWARDSMEFVRLLCDIMPNCRIPIFRSEAAPIIIFTDAEGKKTQREPSALRACRVQGHPPDARIVLVVCASPSKHRVAPRRGAQTRHLYKAIRGDCGHFRFPQFPSGVFRGAPCPIMDRQLRGHRLPYQGLLRQSGLREAGQCIPLRRRHQGRSVPLHRLCPNRLQHSRRALTVARDERDRTGRVDTPPRPARRAETAERRRRSRSVAFIYIHRKIPLG